MGRIDTSRIRIHESQGPIPMKESENCSAKPASAKPTHDQIESLASLLKEMPASFSPAGPASKAENAAKNVLHPQIGLLGRVPGLTGDMLLELTALPPTTFDYLIKLLGIVENSTVSPASERVNSEDLNVMDVIRAIWHFDIEDLIRLHVAIGQRFNEYLLKLKAADRILK